MIEGARESTVAPPAADLSDPPVSSSESRAPAALPVVQLPPPADFYGTQATPEYNLSCEEFFTLLKSTQASTAEEVLRAIRRERPKFLDRVVYAYETRMPYDGASFLYPRIVAYGGTARTVLNFAGHKRQKFYDRVETMCFNEKEDQFEFFDVAFPKEEVAVREGTPEATAALTSEEKLARSVVIPGGRGVRTCRNCHQSPSRPNWDTSPYWPGFYGASDDFLRDRLRSDPPRDIYNSFEEMRWKQFQSYPARQGRYQFVNQELARPNSDFTLKLSYLNGRRIVGDLKRRGAAFENLKWPFARALFCAPRAERRFFRQLTGDTNIQGTIPVLPASADAMSRDIFLSAYYDEVQRERRFGAILGTVDLRSPLPREKFQELRRYYRDLIDPNKELNLDMRLSSVDVDEVLLVRELKRVMDLMNSKARGTEELDIENWSMVFGGGFVHENGLGGDGKIALRFILSRPFVETFLAADGEFGEAWRVWQATERDYHMVKSADGGDASGAATSLDAAKSALCSLVDRRIAAGPAKPRGDH